MSFTLHKCHLSLLDPPHIYYHSHDLLFLRAGLLSWTGKAGRIWPKVMQVAVFANLKYQITNISIILSSVRSCLSLPISGLISLTQILYAHLVIFLFFSSFLYSKTHLTEQTLSADAMMQRSCLVMFFELIGHYTVDRPFRNQCQLSEYRF